MQSHPPMRRCTSAVLAIPLLYACGSPTEGPTARYELPTDVGTPPAVAAVPFPNDVYIDDAGELEIPAEALPFDDAADGEARANAAAGLASQDCFGVTAGVSFPIANLDDGESIDPDAARLAARLTAAGGADVSIDVTVRRDHIIVLEPQRGVVLDPATRYVAALGPELVTTTGRPIAASAAFVRVRDGNPSGPWQQRAAAALEPHLDGDEIAATAFTTCDAGAELDTIAAQLDALGPGAARLDRLYSAAELDTLLGTPDDNSAPGIDNPGGPAHDAISAVAIGQFDAPSFIAETPSTQGYFEPDGAGGFVIKGTAPLTFILALPDLSAGAADLPVVIYQHGLNGGAREVFAVANSLAAAGFATIAIDMPFHGARLPNARDRQHHFTGAEGADGIADPVGGAAALFFFDIQTQPHVTWLDPRIMTDGFRQAVIDVMSLARLLDVGDWSEIASAAPELAGLSFAGEAIAFASESFGGFVGVPVVAFEPRIAGGFLSVGGGGLTVELLESSPVYGPLFMPILQGAFAVDPNEVLPTDAPPHTHHLYQLMAHVLDRADPLAYAARARERGVPLVLPIAHLDESVPNNSSEALAAALGLSWQPGAGEIEAPLHVLPERLPQAAPGAITGIAFARDPAAHGMLSRAFDKRRFVRDGPYFETLDPPVDIDNPIAELQARLVDFAAAVTGR